MSPARWWRRLRFLGRRQRELEELDEEMRLHLELRERQLSEAGLSPPEAARAARLRFGNRTLIGEQSQETWGWGWFDGIVGDLRHAVRLLRATPVFAAVVVLTLALGIGPNAAMFSVMNSIVLRHLPVPEPEQLVLLRSSGPPDGDSNTGNSQSSFSYSVYTQLRNGDTGRVVSDLMAYAPLAVLRTPVQSGSLPEETTALMVSGNFFTGLGVGSTCGRLLTRQDETDRAAVVVLSHAYWSRRFGRDCGVIGQSLQIKGFPFTIVGVAAPTFVGVDPSSPTDLWIPFQDQQELNAWGMSREQSFIHSPEWWCLLVVARLAPGVSEDAALARLQPAFVTAAYAHRGPNARARDTKPPILSFDTSRGVAGLRESYAGPLRLLLAMVALVLVIACGNVSLLLVARNATRQREFAIRLALGGGRRQLLRQLLAESLVLVAAAAVLGWLFAVWATHALASWSELKVDLAPDRRVLLFTVGVSALATVIFGLAPLRSATRSPMQQGLRSVGSGSRGERAWGRRVVVALQVGLCLVLLVGAGLLVRTLRNLEQIPLGMRTAGLLVFGLSPQQNVGTQAETVAFYGRLTERLRALPGVECVTLMENRIGSGWSNNTGVWVDGRRPNGEQFAPVRWNSVGPDYFLTLGVPLRQGREIGEGDVMGAPKVAVVNQTFVDRYLGGRSALGHRMSIGGNGRGDGSLIVGVVADSKYTGVREKPVPMAYLSYKQMNHVSAMHVELRLAGDPEAALPMVRKAVAEVARDLPLEQPRTQAEQFRANLTEDRLFARLAFFFGALALLLVATGLYGTLAYAVSRRTAEIGVRMALGAQRGHVLWLVLRESLLVCAAGIALGLPLALAGAHVLRALLYGVSPGDPVTLALALGGLVAVTFTASMLPARRATAVEPLVALRSD